MFLVVGLHAALGYLTHDIPRVLWCVRDSPTSPIFDWFCWWCMGVSNPLFFTIAGFFAVGLYGSRGPAGFLRDRAKRILLPYAVGVLMILPACLVAWGCGWIASGRCRWGELKRLRFADPVIAAERSGSGHLWFLEYLLVMLAAYAAWRWWSERRGDPRPETTLLDRLVLKSWAPFALALPLACILWVARRRFGVDTALDRHNSFLIEPLKLLYNAAFFVIGTKLYARRQHLQDLARTGPWFLALSVPVFAGRAYYLTQDFARPLTGAIAWAPALFGALFSCLIVLGLVGTALRVYRREVPLLRYLADSSYWVYLVHMPVIGLLQVDLYGSPLPVFAKFPIVLGTTLVFGLTTYRVLVRYTAIGVVLHGRRTRPQIEANLADSSAAVRLA